MYHVLHEISENFPFSPHFNVSQISRESGGPLPKSVCIETMPENKFSPDKC